MERPMRPLQHRPIVRCTRQSATTTSWKLTRWLRHCRRSPLSVIERERIEPFFDLLVMVGIAGSDGHFKRLNPAWEATLGWTRDELLAKPYLSLVHPDDREATAELLAE